MAKRSLWASHVDDWRDCQRCPLSTVRSNVVLARGSIPCDVLFVGEAPGRSEDALGKPFIGPAGVLLDEMIAEAVGDVRYCVRCLRGNIWRQFPSSENPTLCDNGHARDDSAPLRIAFTNLIGCLPLDNDDEKVSEPPYDSVIACSPRLIDLVSFAKPKLIVAVGKHAKEWLEPGMRDSIDISRDIPRLVIVHPAFILRAKDAQKSHLVRRVVVQLRTAMEGL